LSTIFWKPILTSATHTTAMEERINNTAGTSQFELRRKSVKALVGATNVSMTRSACESAG